MLSQFSITFHRDTGSVFQCCLNETDMESKQDLALGGIFERSQLNWLIKKINNRNYFGWKTFHVHRRCSSVGSRSVMILPTKCRLPVTKTSTVPASPRLIPIPSIHWIACETLSKHRVVQPTSACAKLFQTSSCIVHRVSCCCRSTVKLAMSDAALTLVPTQLGQKTA